MSSEKNYDDRTKLQISIDKGKLLGKQALYFGCLNTIGHYLHYPNGKNIHNVKQEFPDLHWNFSLMDTGLLRNGNIVDIYDGKVFWTAGGSSFWYAFYWWDRSFDTRSNSNSGFYVRGFDWPQEQDAFEYACGQFPSVVSRQKHPLLLQR